MNSPRPDPKLEFGKPQCICGLPGRDDLDRDCPLHYPKQPNSQEQQQEQPCESC